MDAHDDRNRTSTNITNFAQRPAVASLPTGNQFFISFYAYNGSTLVAEKTGNTVYLPVVKKVHLCIFKLGQFTVHYPPASNKGSGSNGGFIAGIVVSSILIIVGAGFLVYTCIRWKSLIDCKCCRISLYYASCPKLVSFSLLKLPSQAHFSVSFAISISRSIINQTFTCSPLRLHFPSNDSGHTSCLLSIMGLNFLLNV